MAAAVCNVNDLLDGHVSLEIECLDRIYLNGYVPNLQVGGQIVTFLTGHLGYPVPSPAVFNRVGTAFRRAVAAFAEANAIPIVRFAKGAQGGRDAPLPARGHGPGVVAIGTAQEYQSVFSAYDRRAGEPGPPSYTFAKADRRVSVFYFYVLDAEFGPGFIKVCTYFPVRHEAPYDRVGCRAPPVACRSGPLKLEAA